MKSIEMFFVLLQRYKLNMQGYLFTLFVISLLLNICLFTDNVFLKIILSPLVLTLLGMVLSLNIQDYRTANKRNDFIKKINKLIKVYFILPFIIGFISLFADNMLNLLFIQWIISVIMLCFNILLKAFVFINQRDWLRPISILIKSFISLIFAFFTWSILQPYISPTTVSYIPPEDREHISYSLSALERDYGLSNSAIEDYAVNTYGWNCSSVISVSSSIKTKGGELSEWAYIGPILGKYYNITCSSGKKLRVYPRRNMHPLITNSYGGAR